MADETIDDSELERYLQKSVSSDSLNVDSIPTSPDLSFRKNERYVGQSSSIRHWWDDGKEPVRRSFIKQSKTMEQTGEGGTMRSELSRDSLEESKDKTGKMTQSEDFEDTFSTGAASHPGLDTLEELDDKRMFFAEIEKDRSSAVDYGDLNRRTEMLETTGTFAELEEDVTLTDGDAVGGLDAVKESQSDGKSSSSSSSSSSLSSSPPSSSSLSSVVNSPLEDASAVEEGNTTKGLWQTVSKLSQFETSQQSSSEKFSTVVLDAVQYLSGTGKEGAAPMEERRGFELSPVRGSSEEKVESKEEAFEEEDSDVKELQAALEAAGLPAIGKEGESKNTSYKDDDTKQDSRDSVTALGDELMRGAQQQELTGAAVALAEAHSQREELSIREIPMEDADELRGFDLSPVRLTAEEVEDSKLEESVNVDEIIEDVKRIENELQIAVISAKGNVRERSRKKMPFRASGSVSTTKTVELRRSLLKNEREARPWSKPSEANVRYRTKKTSAAVGRPDEDLRQTVTLRSSHEAQDVSFGKLPPPPGPTPVQQTSVVVEGCNECNSLKSAILEKERSWAAKEAEICRAWEEKVMEVQRELYVVQAKLRAAEDSESHGEGEEKLLKQLKEQDDLIHGYQLENEKLYKEVKDSQIKAKTTESQLFAENRRQANELSHLKSKLERCEGEMAGRRSLGGAGAILGAARISHMDRELVVKEDEVEREKRRGDELEAMNRMLEESVEALKEELAETVERHRAELSEEKALSAVSVDGAEQKLVRFEVERDREVTALKRQLKWYAENQQLLDHDAEKMKTQRDEIARLKSLVMKSKDVEKTVSERGRKKDKERLADARRIQDLERQVREMEQIIRRRHPNSLSALIFAASADRNGRHEGTSSAASAEALEKSVKRLESELDAKDGEWEKKMRALQQRHTLLETRYEEQIQSLNTELDGLRMAHRTMGNAHPHTTVLALEKELASVRLMHQAKVAELEGQAEKWRARAKKGVSQPPGESKSGQMAGEDGDGGAAAKLAEALQRKHTEIEEIKKINRALESEKQELISETQSHPRSREKTEKLTTENRSLKQKVSGLEMELEHQRVHLSAQQAKWAAKRREMEEEAEEKIANERALLKNGMERLRKESLLRSSDSEMTKLKSKLSAQQVMIDHLRHELSSVASCTDLVARARVREERLKQQIERLYEELREAKGHHTPEMHHYDRLITKIQRMEIRHSQREQELREALLRTQEAAGVDVDQTAEFWKREVETKNAEVGKFREELDSILSVLGELKKQGITIPL
eukprot:m.66932 g.66932  ORF g.66932 m.66932 type:complete len:1284 (+) comp35419_c0_seq4:3-3854(+)